MASSCADQAVELLNAAGLESDAGAKVDRLKGLLELVARKEPALLPQFLPHVLELQCDPAVPVRKWLPEFVEATVGAAPTPELLAPCLAGLRALLTDASPGVAKRALLACYSTFRAAYVVLALQAPTAPDPGALAPLWEAAHSLKDAVLALAASPDTNDGVRLGAAKFLEQAALLLTAESVPAVTGVTPTATPLPPGNPLFTKAALVKEAEGALAALTAILKLKLGGAEAPGPLAITAIKAAGTLAAQRPQFCGRLLPPLLALANSGQYHVDGGAAGAASAGVQGSIAAALKATLMVVARSQHPLAAAWRKKIGDALGAMGAAPAPPASASSDRSNKRPRGEEVEASKRPKLEPLAPPQQVPAPTSVPVPMQRVAPPVAVAPPAAPLAAAVPPLITPAMAMAPGTPLPPPTSTADLAQVHAVVQALVTGRDAATLAAFLNGLQPAVLADLVLAQLSSLPPSAAALPPDGALLEPWVLQLLQLVGTDALPALPTAQPLARQATPPPGATAAAAAPAAAAAAAQQPAAARPKLEAAKPKTAMLRLPPGALAFRLEPAPLSGAQEAELRQDALLRILRTEKTPSHTLRAALVARLAAAGAAQADGELEAVVEQLVQDLHTRGGYEIALQWLYVLFGQLCAPFDPFSQPAPALPDDDSAPRPGSSSLAAAADEAAQQASTSGGRDAADTSRRRLPGSRYEVVLLALLRAMRVRLPPSDRTVVRLLAEAPALPMPAVRRHLEAMARAGSDWATLALLAARDIILQRPPSRGPILGLVLEAAAGEDEGTRGKAVRLLANRLFPEPSTSAEVEAFATRQLDALVAPEGKQELQPGQQAQEPQGQQPQQQAGAGGVAAEPVAAGAAAEAADGGGAASEGREAPSVTAGAGEGQQPAAASPPPEQAGPCQARAAQLCALYCALCTKKHSLLRHLFEVFGRTSEGGRAAIHGNAGGLATTLGATAPALLAVVQSPPPGSLPLVLHMLSVLTEHVVPPQPLVAACLQLHSTSRDPRVLVAALPGIEKATLLRLLPALLALPPEALRGALARLVAPLPPPPSAAVVLDAEGQPQAPQPEPAPLSPVEVLTALHTLDAGRDPKLLRAAMQGVTVCLSSPTLFPPEALAATINGLLVKVPLPQLFMRTVIQTLAAAPRLRQFVVGVLGQLVAKRVWEDGAQWKGWLMAAQQTAPDSFAALLQLPSAVLGQALPQLAEGTRAALAGYAASPACTVALPQATRDLLVAADATT